jgi:polysaccharide biosynthesis/export protein
MHLFIVLFLLSLRIPGQTLSQPSATPGPAVLLQSSAASGEIEDHRLTTDDIVDVAVFEVPDLSGTFRVSASGFLTLPWVGPVKVAGLNTNEVARSIEDSLRQKSVKEPHVTVSIKEYMTSSISVMGAVKLPGVQPIKKTKPLMDVVAAAGGLMDAGGSLQVIRGEQVIPISVEDLFQNGKTELNIPIYGGDVVNVLPAMSVFIVGEVMKPGEYPLKFGKGLTVRQAIAIGGGFTKQPKKRDSKIIRYHADGKKEEIPLNLERIMEASHEDLALLPNDILFVPSSKAKSAAMRSLDVAISVASARLIYFGH